MKYNDHQSGMTLIELMIVIAIIGILVGLGYPSYTQYVARAKRAEAISNLMELSQWMERFYTETGAYTGATLPYTKSPKDGTDTDYTISPTIAATTFTLLAAPQGGQANIDSSCGAISVTNTGVKCILADDSSTIKCSNNSTASVKAAVADCF